MPESQTSPLPRLALTMGDVAGIGPEVVARACTDSLILQWGTPLVVGHPEVLRRALNLIGSPLRIKTIPSPRELVRENLTVCCWNPGPANAAEVPAGKNDSRGGRAAYDYLVASAQAALRQEIDAIITAPLSKAALHLAGLNYPGHTEILAEQCGVKDFGMMLYLPPGPSVRSPYGLGVVHVTLHTSIKSVPGLLTTERVAEKIGLIGAFMREVGSPRPRIGVCALNPHAGEEGLFGDEETRIIAPAVEGSSKDEWEASGPFPADTLLKRAVAGEFDGVVAMYHDQGHIALKLIAFETAVNVTLGLPIVRTSPSHGTAFDIAWQGKASAQGMLQAVRIAALRFAAKK
ncbi:MAG: 4-hydroxythreonine-4-phosphate dehydrogenase PdxA [Planctomycetales bacterium]